MDPAAGRLMLVTGATSGIGQAMVEALAARGARVVLAARSEHRARAVIDRLRAEHPSALVEFLPLDLADFGSVRGAAPSVLESGRPLDVLVNNAGVAGTMGLSADGFDLTYATNHLGPFLLTELLRPALEAAPQGRIVNVSSVGHLQAKGIDWARLRGTCRNIARSSRPARARWHSRAGSWRPLRSR